MDELFEPVALQIIQNIENAEEINRRQRFFPTDPFELSDYNFIKLFRLTKNMVENLENLLEPFIPVHQKADAISNRTKILVALRIFASGSYQLDIGRNQTLSVSQPSVSRCLHDVIEAFNNPAITNRYIHFPNTREELGNARQRFFNKYQVPGIIGCIDCTHISIVAPVENEHVYVNRKGYHSLNVQMICDERMQIINVNPRFPGSSHDSFIWQNSNIERFLRELPHEAMGNFYLFGDSGYPVRPWLLTPYLPEPQPDTPEARFNNQFRAIRSTIEQCFGILKNRFRCLLKHRTLHYAPQTAAKIVTSCVVLHNMCIENNVPIYNEDDINPNDDNEGPEPVNLNIGNDNLDINFLRRGREVREMLVNNYFA